MHRVWYAPCMVCTTYTNIAKRGPPRKRRRNKGDPFCERRSHRPNFWLKRGLVYNTFLTLLYILSNTNTSPSLGKYLVLTYLAPNGRKYICRIRDSQRTTCSIRDLAKHSSACKPAAISLSSSSDVEVPIHVPYACKHPTETK